MLKAVMAQLRAELDKPVGRDAAHAVSIGICTGRDAMAAILARSDHSPAFDSNAPFLAYSLTKSMLATVALRLVQSGELDLDGPVARWLPSAPHANLITLRHLLHHSSGLPDYGGLHEYHDAVRAGAGPWKDTEFLERTQARTLLFEPGYGWAYSNIGYMLVTRLLTAVLSQDLGEVLETELFEPLGLKQTFVPTDNDLPELTFGPSFYLGGDGPPVDVRARYRLGWIVHGSVASTASDAATFFHALLNGELLPARLLDEMRTMKEFAPMPDRPFIRPGYGLGLMADLGFAGGPLYGHTGGGPGSSAAAYHLGLKNDSVTVCVFSDGEDGSQVERMAFAGIKSLITT